MLRRPPANEHPQGECQHRLLPHPRSEGPAGPAVNAAAITAAEQRCWRRETTVGNWLEVWAGFKISLCEGKLHPIIVYSTLMYIRKYMKIWNIVVEYYIVK